MVPPGILLYENRRRMSRDWRKHKEVCVVEGVIEA